MKYLQLLFLTSILIISNGCAQKPAVDQPTEFSIDSSSDSSSDSSNELKVGAARYSEYGPLLEGKAVGVVINQTSRVEGQSTLDYLITQGVNVKKIFAPEHGIRGTADRGVLIDDTKDDVTGLPIVSLYGKKKKPSSEVLEDIDVMIFDIQDVGARFYTYISTMHYLMEACAENSIRLIVMDRPNPNGHYIIGPIMEEEHKSFLGMHSVPVVHGMTIGEYALMINGEGWLSNDLKCDLKVITMKGWTHSTSYSLPIPPSPNLPNDQSIALYPSLCFFEGTPVSVGRGTTQQFQIIGHPDYTDTIFSFRPTSSYGAKYPVLQDKICYGLDLTKADRAFTLKYLMHFYEILKHPEKPFFTDFFTLLAGTKELQQQIESGMSEKDIIASWQPGLEQFKQIRSKYLQYKDFE